jgi:hypothetical protein
VQGAVDGKGKKFATLLGFKNGGPGKHVLTFADGTTLQVESREAKPTIVTSADGTEFATVHRGDTTSAVRAGGAEIMCFASDPDEAWTLARAADAAWQTYIWWDHAGQALPVPSSAPASSAGCR